MPITSGRLGRLQRVSRRGTDAVFSFESSDLVLTPLGSNWVRHSWIPAHWRLHKQAPEHRHAVIREDWPGASFEIIENDRSVTLRCPDLVIEASRDPFHLRYLTGDGRALLEEVEEGGLSWSYWEYELRYQLGAQDHFYGMGQPDQLEGVLGLDHRGHRREIWNQHAPPAVTIFPAFVNPRGYGLLVDNPYRAHWDLGHSDKRAFSYKAGGGPLQYYFFYGNGLRGLLRAYLELTGFPPHPPKWIFGLLQSRYGYKSRAELEEIARTFREKRLPCDALILDLFWFSNMGDLAFNSNWPDPPAMIARLAEQGFHLMLIEEPYITESSSNFAQASRRGLLAKRGDGSPYTFDFWPGRCALVDFSNPAARQWWSEKHRPLLEMGVAGFWTDLNEPTRHFEDMAHHGGCAAAVHNLTALWMHQAIAQAHERYAPRRRIFILSRSAYPGSQRYGAGLWSGDVAMTFESLRQQVAVGLSAGMAGIAWWGSDIGGFGFGGKCTPQLYVRWFQFGAFCPLFRPHGDQTELREPWQFGPQCEAICRQYLELRYRLLPYIYSCAHQACTTGLPLMRPLALEFPDDPDVMDMSDQYLFGPDILVAPVLEEGATQRTVYFPAGSWTDLRTEQVIAGPRHLDVAAPLEVLPLFIRQGAIIPAAPPMQHCGERTLDPLTLEIYPAGNRSFVLYEDDGETAAYRDGEYAETTIEVCSGANSMSCLIGAARGGFARFNPQRTIVINVHRQGAVSEVTCAGMALARAADSESLERIAAGWYWDRSRQILAVKFRHSAKPALVEIR